MTSQAHVYRLNFLLDLKITGSTTSNL